MAKKKTSTSSDGRKEPATARPDGDPEERAEREARDLVRRIVDGGNLELGHALHTVAVAADRLGHSEIRDVLVALNGALWSSPRRTDVIEELTRGARAALRKAAGESATGNLLWSNAHALNFSTRARGLAITTKKDLALDLRDAVRRELDAEAGDVLRVLAEELAGSVKFADRQLGLFADVTEADAEARIAKVLERAETRDAEELAIAILRALGMTAGEAHDLFKREGTT